MIDFPYWIRVTVFSSGIMIFLVSGVTAFTDRIAAIVNKEVITLSELKNEVRDEHIRLQARYSGAELKQRMANKEYQVLNNLIEERLQLQEARSKGFTVTEEELDKALRQSSNQSQHLALSEDELTEQTKKRILLDKIRAFEVRRIVTISDSEISQYYKDHQESFMVSRIYRLRQILFLAESEDERAHKLSQAKVVFQRLQAGESFRELALQYSAGPEASEGGELGLVQHDELLTPIAEALQTLNPGEIGPPHRNVTGYSHHRVR